MARPDGDLNPPSYKENLKIVLHELQRSKVFDRIPGQKHGS